MENAADAEFAVLDSLQKMAEKQLRAKEAEMGEVYLGFQRFLFLQSIDQLWMEHLDSMDHLRTSVNLQGYGQKDPLVEYKRRGYEMFQRLLKDINSNFARTILRVTLTPQSENKELRIKNNELGVNAESSSPQSWVTNRSDNPPSSPRPLGEGRGEGHSNIGRNDPCPCGAINPATGQVYKYKKCGLINASYHKR
jgi:preprotein translocase subunit SecA